MANIVPGMVVGAQQIRGLWRLYLKSFEARVALLIKGVHLKGRHIQMYDTNPFITNSDNPKEMSEKITISELPLSVSNTLITTLLDQYPQVKIRSKVLYSKEHDEDGKLSDFLNGDRYLYAEYPIMPPLPKDINIGTFKCKVYHRCQKFFCKRCQQSGHTTRDIKDCDAYVDEQWKKCSDLLKPEIAEAVYKSLDAREAKYISKQIPYDNSLEWEKSNTHIMKDILEAKFTSCPEFRSYLLKRRNYIRRSYR